MSQVNDKETQRVRTRYDRISGMYGVMEQIMGRADGKWRTMWLQRIAGKEVLEVGVGTGRSLPFYPTTVRVTGIDFSPRMLERARRKLEPLQRTDIRLVEADVQALPFADESFDTVLTSCVFCSVPNPKQGLREIRRVLRKSGRLVMLEHVLSCKPGLRQLMHIANPLVRRMVGANINRDTRTNIEAAGFTIIEEENLWLDVMMLFVARP